MEIAYLLDLIPNFKFISNFASSENYHSRISAIQLMGNINFSESKKFLFNNEKFSDFEKVIAIWSLRESETKPILSN